ncbi:hypothetical protein BKA93DRAFT_561318 [Sparassis latifolia]
MIKRRVKRAFSELRGVPRFLIHAMDTILDAKLDEPVEPQSAPHNLDDDRTEIFRPYDIKKRRSFVSTLLSTQTRLEKLVFPDATDLPCAPAAASIVAADKKKATDFVAAYEAMCNEPLDMEEAYVLLCLTKGDTAVNPREGHTSEFETILPATTSQIAVAPQPHASYELPTLTTESDFQVTPVVSWEPPADTSCNEPSRSGEATPSLSYAVTPSSSETSLVFPRSVPQPSGFIAPAHDIVHGQVVDQLSQAHLCQEEPTAPYPDAICDLSRDGPKSLPECDSELDIDMSDSFVQEEGQYGAGFVQDATYGSSAALGQTKDFFTMQTPIGYNTWPVQYNGYLYPEMAYLQQQQPLALSTEPSLFTVFAIPAAPVLFTDPALSTISAPAPSMFYHSPPSAFPTNFYGPSPTALDVTSSRCVNYDQDDPMDYHAYDAMDIENWTYDIDMTTTTRSSATTDVMDVDDSGYCALLHSEDIPLSADPYSAGYDNDEEMAEQASEVHPAVVHSITPLSTSVTRNRPQPPRTRRRGRRTVGGNNKGQKLDDLEDYDSDDFAVKLEDQLTEVAEEDVPSPDSINAAETDVPAPDSLNATKTDVPTPDRTDVAEKDVPGVDSTEVPTAIGETDPTQVPLERDLRKEAHSFLDSLGKQMVAAQEVAATETQSNGTVNPTEVEAVVAGSSQESEGRE